MIASEEPSLATTGLNVRGGEPRAKVNRPPNWPGSAGDTRGDGGRGCGAAGLDDLRQPVSAQISRPLDSRQVGIIDQRRAHEPCDKGAAFDDHLFISRSESVLPAKKMVVFTQPPQSNFSYRTSL